MVAATRPVRGLHALVAALQAVLVTACYHPTAAEGLACSTPGMRCPTGQTCDPVDLVCRRPENLLPDGGTDCGPLDLQSSLLERVVPSDPAVSASFGAHVAASDRWLVVGVENDDDLGIDAGAVYVFELMGGTYNESAKLQLGGAGDHFGSAVAVAGDRIAIGANGANGDIGRAYVYSYSGSAWSLTKTIDPSDGMAGDAFGSATAISTASLAIGAPGRSSGEGLLYLFESSDTYAVETALMPEGATQSFAAALAMSDTTLAVGTPGASALTGAVAVLRRNGTSWAGAAQLTATDGAAGDQFGFAVAVDGQRVAIGAPFHLGKGAAYVFEDTGSFGQIGKVTANAGQANDAFGTAVALRGNRIIVGAPSHDASGTNSGAGFVFDKIGSDFTELATIADPMAAEFDELGDAVALTSAGPLLGSPLHDEGGTANSGTVLSFELSCAAPTARR